MSCKGCIHALEQGAYVIFEMARTYPNLLPATPPKFESYKEMGEFLVDLAGKLRQAGFKPS